MSHDSGFRRGGRDLTHGMQRGRKGGGRSARKYEERKSKRFREHERTATKDEERNTED